MPIPFEYMMSNSDHRTAINAYGFQMGVHAFAQFAVILDDDDLPFQIFASECAADFIRTTTTDDPITLSHLLKKGISQGYASRAYSSQLYPSGNAQAA